MLMDDVTSSVYKLPALDIIFPIAFGILSVRKEVIVNTGQLRNYLNEKGKVKSMRIGG